MIQSMEGMLGIQHSLQKANIEIKVLKNDGLTSVLAGNLTPPKKGGREGWTGLQAIFLIFITDTLDYEKTAIQKYSIVYCMHN